MASSCTRCLLPCAGRETGRVSYAARAGPRWTLCLGFVREYGRRLPRWEIKYSAGRHLKNE
ncbi:hypothetical protein BCEN4_600005 [Burkholderia cenocepacia]|nr:hypothetical protein BCEN4_600005 [Burkholderia cenocepacia]